MHQENTKQFDIMLRLIQQFFTLNFMKSSEKKTLSWEALSLTFRPLQKPILRNLHGSVSSGQFLTIMGPSGAGKSSFLSIITARMNKKTQNFVLQGSAMLNGQCFGVEEFSRNAAYVRQDDILLGTLTVEETFAFQAKLKLNTFSDIERNFKIDQILKQLNLQQCRKVLVGSQFSKSISGGQRKRVAIGVELLADPSILILDQPTSGLDSHNALKIIKILRNLAKEEQKIIIATIHQPSSRMFHEMQSLFLLSGGSTLYFGPSQRIVPYMEQIGVKIDYRMNPADFFMLQISQMKKQRKYLTPMTSQKFEKIRQEKPYLFQEDKKSEEKSESVFRESIFNIVNYEQAKGTTQLTVLMRRSWMNFYRVPSNIIGKFVVALVIFVLMVALYNNIGNKFPKDLTDQKAIEKYLNEFGAFIFMFTFSSFGSNVYDTVLSFPSQKQLVLKQSSSGLYSLGIYYFSRCLVQLPIIILSHIISSLGVYWAASLDPRISHISIFVLAICMVGVVGYMMGTFIGIAFSKSEHAVQILPLIIIPFVIFGGLVVNLNDIPGYANWMQYASPIRHAYSSIMIDQLGTERMHNFIEIPLIKQLVGINGDLWTNITYLAICLFVVNVLSVSLLFYKRKAI